MSYILLNAYTSKLPDWFSFEVLEFLNYIDKDSQKNGIRRKK